MELIQPKPRPAKLFNCLILSLYCSTFLLFLTPWMNKQGDYFKTKLAILWGIAAVINFMILYKRQALYDLLCKVRKNKIRFFEAPFVAINGLLFTFVFLIAPFYYDLIDLRFGVSDIFQDNNLTMYVLFSGGALLVSSGISGFDIYPVNTFGTKKSVENLISITRDLIRASNRVLILLVGSVIFGWVFKKVEFSLPVIYITIYIIIGFALGATATLGSRITDLLYLQSELEISEDDQNANATKQI